MNIKSAFPIPAYPFDLGPRLWAMVPPNKRADLLRHYMQRASQIILKNGLIPPEPLRLELIVVAAAEAECLYFAAALYEPGQQDRDRFFAEFITRSL